MRRSLPAVIAVLVALLVAAPGHGSSPPTPWDGTNPFRCTLQAAGLGGTVPDPGADPYCVDFDKTHQNVAELGVVGFLSKEPARTAAAVPKCFYFQSDHWRGSVLQDDGSTKTYQWDGHYFFDKAYGEGGVWVTNFNVNGRTADPSEIPGLPPQYAKYFGPGTGGFITHDQVKSDPTCAARAQKSAAQIYAPRSTAAPTCSVPHGTVGARHVAEVALGEREAAVRRRLGAPRRLSRGFLHYCRRGGGELLVGEAQDRSGELGASGKEKAIVVLSTAPKPAYAGIHPGLRHVWRGARRVLHSRDLAVYVHRGVIAGVRGGRVSFLGVYDRRAVRSAARLRTYLIRAR